MSTPAQHAPPNTPAAEVLSQARRQAHAWTDFMKNFEGCFVQSIGGSQAIPDPFRIKHVDTLLLDSLAPTILAAVKEESQRSFDKAKFIGDLYHAYTRALALAKTSAGSAVPVKDVFFELVMVKQSPKFAKAPSKSNFQEYPKEFFLRDLAKLAASGSLATRSGKRLVLAPSAFSADAFPILEANAVRYIGRIAFTDFPD